MYLFRIHTHVHQMMFTNALSYIFMYYKLLQDNLVLYRIGYVYWLTIGYHIIGKISYQYNINRLAGRRKFLF